MKKQKYIEAEIEIIEFESDDVIVTSFTPNGDDDSGVPVPYNG